MSTEVKFRRGTTTEHSSFTGAVGEMTVDTTKKVVVVHDGSTAGGTPLAKETHTHTFTFSGDATGSGTGSVTLTIPNDTVTYAKLQNVSATSRMLGRITAGAGDVEELTGTQATTLLDAFTSSLKGLAPASGGGTTNFLRADGTWAAPPGGGGGVSDGDKGDITVSGSGATWTIDADAVSYSKIQNVSATDKVLGRSTAGAGDIEEIACTAAGRALIDDADAAAQRTTLGLGTLATQNGTFSGTSSGTNTGDQTTITGNAGTATALQTARNINGVAFDGTANITVTAAGSTLTGTSLAGTIVTSSLTAVGTITTGVWNGTAIAVANGGTGATSAGGARTNLGLAIGSDVQGYNANALKRQITVTIGDGSSVPAVNTQAWVRVPFGATITKASISADASGSAVVDVWKDTHANFPPTIADTITASAKPTLSSAIKNEDSTLTGWTTSITAGDWVLFNLDSVTTCKKITVTLELTI